MLYVDPVSSMSQKYGVHMRVEKLLHTSGYSVYAMFGGRLNTGTVYTAYIDNSESVAERVESVLRNILAEIGYYGT